MDFKIDEWSASYFNLYTVVYTLHNLCYYNVDFKGIMCVGMHSNRWHLMILLCLSWWIHHQFLLLLPHLYLRSLVPVRPILSSTSFNHASSMSTSSLHVERSLQLRFEGHSKFPAKLWSLQCSNLWQSMVRRWELARYRMHLNTSCS